MIHEAIARSILFRGLSEAELTAALAALGAGERTYRRGETVLHAGSTTRQMGIVLSGSVTIESNDPWGNRTILELAETGDFFAEVYALLGDEPLLVDVRANEDSRILLLTIGRALDEEHGGWQSKIVRNLLRISARKNLTLSGRAFHTAPKTIRGRLMAYLDTMALRTSTRSFTVPFDRQQLADYLNVDRTALSKELGKMKKDGLIDCHLNRFTIL